MAWISFHRFMVLPDSIAIWDLPAVTMPYHTILESRVERDSLALAMETVFSCLAP